MARSSSCLKEFLIPCTSTRPSRDLFPVPKRVAGIGLLLRAHRCGNQTGNQRNANQYYWNPQKKTSGSHAFTPNRKLAIKLCQPKSLQ